MERKVQVGLRIPRKQKRRKTNNEKYSDYFKFTEEKRKFADAV